MGNQTFGSIIPETSAAAYHGIIYRIDCAGKYYIGKKALLIGVNYKTYKSSSVDMKQLLKNNEGTFTVLAYAESKRELSYLEVKYQFLNNCLEDANCLNKNINGKWYRNRLK